MSNASPPVAVELLIKSMVPSQRLVYGFASVAEVDGVPVVDHEGEVIPIDEIQKAAHDYILNARIVKAEHGRFNDDRVKGEVVESMVMTDSLAKALGIETPVRGWLVAMKINDDEAWAKVQSGEYAAMSIGGTARSEKIS